MDSRKTDKFKDTKAKRIIHIRELLQHSTLDWVEIDRSILILKKFDEPAEPSKTLTVKEFFQWYTGDDVDPFNEKHQNDNLLTINGRHAQDFPRNYWIKFLEQKQDIKIKVTYIDLDNVYEHEFLLDEKEFIIDTGEPLF